jgi:serine-type D-Ala-D-Ala endopeptidase (penicillin-binding protein 7)
MRYGAADQAGRARKLMAAGFQCAPGLLESASSHLSPESPAEMIRLPRAAALRISPICRLAVLALAVLFAGVAHAADLRLKSNAVLVIDQDTGETLAQKNADRVMPIASLTKLMTALVVLESGLPLDETLTISREDIDTIKRTASRLTVGTRLTRDELLLLALMSSENRASSALSRHYPGGRDAFIARMNVKARELGLTHTHFADAAGLSKRSVSTARDLALLVAAADAQPLIRDYSTRLQDTVRVKGGRLTFVNSNRLVRKRGDWDIGLQKTGFTNEAGRCLVMQANVLGRRLAMVFLNSNGTLTRYADAARVRRALQQQDKTPPAKAVPASVSSKVAGASS